MRDRGCTEIIGPFNPSIHDQCGLLEKAEPPLMYGYPLTPPHAIELLEACGYRRRQRLLNYRLPLANPSAERMRKHLAPQLDNLGQQGLELRRPSWRRFNLQVQWLRTLINACWSDNWGFEPIGLGETRMLLLKVMVVLPPGALWFVLHDGEPAGFCLGLPDLNQLSDGIDQAWGLLRFVRLVQLSRRGEGKAARVALLGMVPSLQGSALSLVATTALLARLIEVGRGNGFQTVDMGWILETNSAMLRFLRLYGGEPVSSHLILGRELERSVQPLR